MTNTELFDLWRARAVEDPDLLTELDGIRGDADAINDRFYRDLAFGTGGLRGVIGAGSNRMNIYTIRRATQGLADYINAAGLPKKVAIGHDSRHKGELFSREAARVLAANGITAYLYPPAGAHPGAVLGCALSGLRRGHLRDRQPQPRQVQRLQGLWCRRLPDHAGSRRCRAGCYRQARLLRFHRADRL